MVIQSYTKRKITIFVNSYFTFLWGYMLFVSDYLGGSLNLLLRQQVQLVQVGLDVAVGDLLTLLDAQDLAHGGIRVDGVALLGILQLVRVNIG